MPPTEHAIPRNRRCFHVERCMSRAVNQRVVGSSPTWGAIKTADFTTISAVLFFADFWWKNRCGTGAVFNGVQMR